jgi:GNAT superfamily N-acetyltransferase
MQRHDFSGPHDLRAMQDLCSRVWTPRARFHPGQLAWSRYYLPVDPHRPADDEAIATWCSGADVVAFGWAETRDWLELQVDPAHSDVAGEVLGWFEDWSGAGALSVVTMDGDPVEDALLAAGWTPQHGSWHFTHHFLDLDDLTEVPAVPGYAFRPVRPDEPAARSACHRAAWSDDSPSRVTPDSYAALMAAWPYRTDLDWVAVTDDGEMVASCLVWLDERTGVGLVEPVGCAPAHRGRGLAAAVTAAALHRLRDLGATTAMVSPRGDDGHPGPMQMYQGLGFRPRTRTVTWRRER